MAKNQITEEQLARGLHGMGGFSGLTQRPKRDHPFRTSQEESVKVADVEPHIVPRPTEQALPKPVVENKVETTTETQPMAKVREDKIVSIDPRRIVEEEPSIGESEVLSAVVKPSGKKKPPRHGTQSTRKADIFSERVTLQLSPRMRDKADSLAKELQRLRTSKEERITANTIMRVAIKLVLDKFKPGAGESPANNEEELFELVKKQLCER